MTIDASGYVLILLGIGISYLAVHKKNFLLGVLASAIWIIFLIFMHQNTFGGFAVGSAGDTVTTVVLLGLAISVPIISLSFWRQEKKYNERDEQEFQFKQNERKASKPPTYSDITSTSNSVNLQDMSDADYMKLLQRQTRRNKK
jgi:K+-sensing histidine kinase KdpD